MDFLTEYGVFLAEVVTIVIAILLVVAGISAAGKGRKDDQHHLDVKHLNKRLEQQKEALEGQILSKEVLKAHAKEKKAALKQEKKNKKQEPSVEEQRKRVFVIDFVGDIKASHTPGFSDAITGVLGMARAGTDEIVVRLESAGGMVHAYGLASAQMDRIRNAGLQLTACVDKVAASGGYMMACVADKIVASPFAIMGSIGVVAQLPNFHKLLKKNEIDYEILTAGEYKRTLTMFGENTEKGREKFKQDLEDTHQLFKDYVSKRRPSVDMKEVANGDIWFGTRALEKDLVDELKTSDEYLVEACNDADVYKIEVKEKKNLLEKLGLAVESGVERGVEKLWQRMNESKFF